MSTAIRITAGHRVAQISPAPRWLDEEMQYVTRELRFDAGRASWSTMTAAVAHRDRHHLEVAGRAKASFRGVIAERLRGLSRLSPHEGLGVVHLPHPRGAPLEDEVEALPFELRDIQCQYRLGGLLKHYYRTAA